MTEPTLSALLQRFFTGHLTVSFGASPHAIASYRDSVRLLLRFAARQRGCQPTDLEFGDLDADMIGSFLSHLEEERDCSPASRNVRLAAIRSFFRFVANREPRHLHQCRQILAIPGKRHDRPAVTWLDRDETAALVGAPDTGSWIGRRDRCLLALALQTGLRVSEIIALTHDDIRLGDGAHVHCWGKGRKERAVPLRKDAIVEIEAWMAGNPGRPPDAPLFATRRGTALSRDAVERIVKRHVATAARACPPLGDKRVTCHSLRHSAAMELLRSEVDCEVIALWLGHESLESTQIYLHADLELKERAMERTRPADVPAGRYRPPDNVMAYLDGLVTPG